MDRFAGLLAALALLALAAGPLVATTASAHGGETHGMRTLLFTVHDGVRDGETVSWFQIANRTDANPMVGVDPGERVIIHLSNVGNRSHNLRVEEPVMTATPVVEPGNETSITMKVPEDAPTYVGYHDQVHRDDGAEGRFRVTGGEAADDEGGLLADPLVLAGVGGLAIVGLGWWSGRRSG